MKQSATDSVWAKIDDADICEYIFHDPPIFILTEFEDIFDRLPLYVKGGELKVIAGKFTGVAENGEVQERCLSKAFAPLDAKDNAGRAGTTPPAIIR